MDTSSFYKELTSKKFVFAGPNVIESEEHCYNMASKLKDIFAKYDVTFVFKVSFDKANRTSITSYRGVPFKEGCRILKRIKEELGVRIITDVHEIYQAKPIADIVDIIQIPAFLGRQTDLLKAVAETGIVVQIKKGQMFSADVMHKCKEKLIAFGNPNVILCERGNFFGYQDLVVDPRNLVWLKSDTNLVSMDITHCLQAPAQKLADGTVKAGGHRELIPYMGKLAMAFDVDGVFMEVHDNPDASLCDAPTQWYLDRLEELLDTIGIKRHNNYNVQYTSTSNIQYTDTDCTVGTIEADTMGFYGRFEGEELRGQKILDKLLECEFDTVLDVGAGKFDHSRIFNDHGKIVDAVDYGNSVYFNSNTSNIDFINELHIGDFNKIEFDKTYNAIWCSHILEHQTNVGLFLRKLYDLLDDDGYLAIVVPPRKPLIVGGHVTIWNAGLILYNLVLAGFDCSDAKILQYDYNIGVIIRKKSVDIKDYENISMDKGDIELLSKYFPFDAKHDFNGDILKLNW